jgi:hypothetical protein
MNLPCRAPSADTHRLVLQGVEAAVSLSSVLREEPPPYGD